MDVSIKNNKLDWLNESNRIRLGQNKFYSLKTNLFLNFKITEHTVLMFLST